MFDLHDFGAFESLARVDMRRGKLRSSLRRPLIRSTNLIRGTRETHTPAIFAMT